MVVWEAQIDSSSPYSSNRYQPKHYRDRKIKDKEMDLVKLSELLKHLTFVDIQWAVEWWRIEAMTSFGFKENCVLLVGLCHCSFCLSLSFFCDTMWCFSGLNATNFSYKICCNCWKNTCLYCIQDIRSGKINGSISFAIDNMYYANFKFQEQMSVPWCSEIQNQKLEVLIFTPIPLYAQEVWFLNQFPKRE